MATVAALRELLEKGSDAGFLREMIGFAAERLMALETQALCGAAPRRVPRVCPGCAPCPQKSENRRLSH